MEWQWLMLRVVLRPFQSLVWQHLNFELLFFRALFSNECLDALSGQPSIIECEQFANCWEPRIVTWPDDEVAVYTASDAQLPAEPVLILSAVTVSSAYGLTRFWLTQIVQQLQDDAKPVEPKYEPRTANESSNDEQHAVPPSGYDAAEHAKRVDAEAGHVRAGGYAAQTSLFRHGRATAKWSTRPIRSVQIEKYAGENELQWRTRNAREEPDGYGRHDET